jgi:hypothetical protein
LLFFSLFRLKGMDDVNNASAKNVNAVGRLDWEPMGDPPTTGECGEIVTKLNELIAALKR